MKTTHFFFSWLLCAFPLTCFIAVCQLKAQTVGQVETTVKARPVQMGPLYCTKPVIVSNKRQVLSDADFKALKDAAKVDSGKTCSNYNVVPLSAAMERPPKSIIEKVIDFIFGG